MATAPRAPSSRPLWTACALPAAAELEELGDAVLVEVPVSSSDEEVLVAAAEVVLTPEAPYVALTRMAPVPVAVAAVALPMGK